MNLKASKIIKLALISIILLFSSTSVQSAEENKKLEEICKHLEEAFNQKDLDTLNNIFTNDKMISPISKYTKFAERFPTSKWEVRPGKDLKDGRNSLQIFIIGNHTYGHHNYSLEAKQHLAVKINQGRIISQEILGEQSIMQTNKDLLPIRLGIPDYVLTGSRYDIDIILEKPLGDSILAGGLISLSKEEVKKNISPPIELEPMGGGGLFKTVKAPFNSGLQTWSAFIAHPKGLISVTKMVRVVSEESELY
tara:strand:- start:48 stop:800 length:753 start_codon:yes stop_codon:yes gene_type:complete